MYTSLSKLRRIETIARKENIYIFFFILTRMTAYMFCYRKKYKQCPNVFSKHNQGFLRSPSNITIQVTDRLDGILCDKLKCTTWVSISKQSLMSLFSFRICLFYSLLMSVLTDKQIRIVFLKIFTIFFFYLKRNR